MQVIFVFATAGIVYGQRHHGGGGEPQPQYVDYQAKGFRQLPTILMHKQALSQDGNFNYAFAADNGLKQGETISPDGSRSGAYSYVDPNGQTISVRYTAGKEGFRILEGEHIPKAPPAPAYHQPAPQAAYQYSGPQYSSGAQYSGAQYSAPSYSGPRHRFASASQDEGQYNEEDDGSGGINNALAYYNRGQQAYQKSGSAPVYRVQENDGGYNEKEEEQYNKGPHTFGSGYAFEFSG